jgi:hypothetical protein
MLLKLEQQHPYHNGFELVKHLPTFIPLRNHPEFIALIDRVDKRKAEALRRINAFDKNS